MPRGLAEYCVVRNQQTSPGFSLRNSVKNALHAIDLLVLPSIQRNLLALFMHIAYYWYMAMHIFFVLSCTNAPSLWHDAAKHRNSLNNHTHVKYRLARRYKRTNLYCAERR
jgi:hypothetical protein